jgi:uncharacterized protein YfaS (alpha-2-macroglobulin family)
MNVYPRGATVILQAVCQTFGASWQNITPTNLILRVIDPAGNETDYLFSQLINNGLGVYIYPLQVNIVGLWRYRFQGSGTCPTAGEGALTVANTTFS